MARRAKRLAQLKLDAKREGWADMIRTASDEAALLDGCRFDRRRAEHVEEFGRKFLRVTKGPRCGQPFEALAYQRDWLLYPLFGWVKPDGTRRHRYMFCLVPKKNAKSTFCAFLNLYLLVADGEPRPEVYATAVDRSQARIVYSEAAAMVKASPILRKRITITESTKTLTYGDGMLQALSGEHASSEGKDIHGLTCDEVHAWTTPKLRKLWASLYYSDIARPQPIRTVITTAGEEDETAIWTEEAEKARAILSGELIDTSRVCYVAEASKEDDWTDPDVHRRANPAYDVIINPERMIQECEDAQRSAAAKARFCRYRLNLVVSLDVDWLDGDLWDACDGEAILDEHGSTYAGLDLSSSSDITALALVCRRPAVAVDDDAEVDVDDEEDEREDPDHGDDDEYHVRVRCWVPEDTVRQLEADHDYRYRQWIDDGWLEMTPGNVIDHAFIRQAICEEAERHQVLEVAYDPWHATELAVSLENDEGLTMVEVRQGARSLSEPMKKLERLVKRKRIHHGGNPVLSWMIRNVRARSDPNGNIRPVKPDPKSKLKIDGIVAIINALSRAMLGGGASDYETAGDDAL